MKNLADFFFFGVLGSCIAGGSVLAGMFIKVWIYG